MKTKIFRSMNFENNAFENKIFFFFCAYLFTYACELVYACKQLILRVCYEILSKSISFRI